MEYDVFICHASEDKEEFVEPLANALVQKGLKVWYDRFELKLGDSLRRKIDQGLSNSRYGVVVLSKAFFQKEWPQDELDALVGKENEERRKVILPIWHNISAQEVKQFSPILASKLAVRSDVGLDSIVTQIIEVCKEEVAVHNISVFQSNSTTNLREKCLSVVRDGDKLAWRKLVHEVGNPITQQLVNWKERGGSAAHKGGEAWENTVFEAVEICLPGFVPIFVGVETGKKDFWKESVSTLRMLAMVKDEMDGGATWALGIGAHMLYVAGSLGMALAVETKQLDFVNEWMLLPMPNPDSDRHEQKPWADIFAAHRLPPGLKPSNKEHFKFLLKVCESDHLSGFFPMEKRLVECLFLANLLQSLVELRRCTESEECKKALEREDWKQFQIDVWPFWCLMKHRDFQSSTWNIFGSSKGVLEFVFPSGFVTPDKFWPWWKSWKKICAAILQHNARGFLFLRPEWLVLPGEPRDKVPSG